MPRFLSPSLALLAVAPAVHAAPQTLDEDVQLTGTATVSLAAPRTDAPEAIASRGDELVLLGNSYGLQGIDRLPFLTQVGSDGVVDWHWIGSVPDEQAAGLFVPPAGVGAFATIHDIDGDLRIVRIDGGQLVWNQELPNLLSFNPLSYQPVLDLTGSADGSRLFGLLAREYPANLLTSHDPSDGSTIWARELPTDADPVAFACDDTGARIAVLFEGAGALANDRVLCFDGATGAVVWTLNLAPELNKTRVYSIAVDPAGGLGFVGVDPTGTLDLSLLAFDLASGSVAWTAALPGAVRALDYSSVGPDLIAVTQDLSVFQTAPLTVHAVRPLAGVTQWSRTLAPTARTNGGLGLAVDDATQKTAVQFDSSQGFSPGLDGTVALLDVFSGGLDWIGTDTSTIGFIAYGGVVFAELQGAPIVVRARGIDGVDGSLDADISAFDVGSGAQVWQEQLAFDAVAPTGEGLVAPVDSPLVFASVRDSAERRNVAAVDLATGTVVWQTELGIDAYEFGNYGPGNALAATADGSVVVGARAGSSTFEPGEIQAFDGATGQVLWQDQHTFIGNAHDLLIVEPAAAAPYLLSHHHSNGDSLGDTTLRAYALDGTLLWTQDWPTSGFNYWWAGTLAADVGLGRVFAVVAAQFPADELRVVVRQLTDGALLDAFLLTDDDFAPGVELGVPLPLDIVLRDDASELFVLGSYLGTVNTSPHLVAAALDPLTGTKSWGAAFDPSPVGSYGPGELILAPADDWLTLVAGVSVGTADRRTAMLGLDAATGALRWERLLGDAADPREYLDAVGSDDGAVVFVSLGRADGDAEVAALDATTGATLWTALLDGGSSGDRARNLAVRGGEVFALLDATATVPTGVATIVVLDPEELVAGPDAIALTDGGTLVLLLDRPAASAGAPYLVLGSASGTTPGLALGGVVLPLNLDGYLLAAANAPNQAPFVDTFGLLDPAGDARAAVVVPTGLSPSLAGLTLHHAFVELDLVAGTLHASEPVTLSLVP